MKIAVPSMAPGGLDADLSAHFGHCDIFTLIDVEGSEIKNVELLHNMGHEQGGCMAPVMLLRDAGVKALSAGGMGMRPLAGFQQVGIDVYYNEGASAVKDAVEQITSGKAPKFGQAQVCGGHGHEGGCGGH